LLNINSEQELEHFLGDLMKTAGKAIGAFVNSDTGQQLGGYLKSAAKKMLPTAGQAIGNYLGGDVGGKIGGQIGSAASGLFEMETEDEFEAAKTFVRLAADSVRNALENPQSAGSARAAAAAAVKQAAETHAPQLLQEVRGALRQRPGTGYYSQASRTGGATETGRQGTWIVRGNNIVLLGAAQ